MDGGYREPTAKELVQRRKIILANSSSLSGARWKVPLSPHKAPPLSANLTCGTSFASLSLMDAAQTPTRNESSTRKHDTVTMLHQNGRNSLLYGKNNVVSLARERNRPMKGYLSLHKDNVGTLVLKWTPNVLMSAETPGEPPETPMWRHALTVNMEGVVYVHLHQKPEIEQFASIVVLVDRGVNELVVHLHPQQVIPSEPNLEGLQLCSFKFESGKGALTFLVCLESALEPLHRLEPPLAEQHGDKMLPRCRRYETQLSTPSPSVGSLSVNESVDTDQLSEEGTVSSASADQDVAGEGGAAGPMEVEEFSSGGYIFRIVSYRGNCDAAAPINTPRNSSQSEEEETQRRQPHTDAGFRSACESIRLRIKARAFHGWLGYCRQLRTIRSSLASLINPTYVIEWDEADSAVNEDFWALCRAEKTVATYKQLLHRVYLKGVEEHLRAEVWPYLLRVVDWHEEVRERSDKWRKAYSKDLLAWQSVEAEVMRRDAEAFQAARLRQQSSNDATEHSSTVPHSPNANDALSAKECGIAEMSHDTVLIEEFGNNLHRIEKDVERCDRTTEFFSKKGYGDENLPKLKRLMCTYGYIQGMCDIASPLLVIFKDEVIACECFAVLMQRMRINFPQNKEGIECSLNNLRSIVQVMDPDLFKQMMNSSDYTHLYFAYRWLLLDFKRELTYDEVFRVWEVIWAAERTVSPQFQLFLCLSLLGHYREVLIENNFDYTDVLKFFNEMAEKHDVEELLRLAKSKLRCLQEMVRELNK